MVTTSAEDYIIFFKVDENIIYNIKV